jgi:hypothetical protein
VHSNGAFNNHIRILLRGIKFLILTVQLIETHLDSGTAGKLRALRRLISVHGTTGVELTRNLVLVSLYELSNHIPKKMHLFSLRCRHSGSKIAQLTLSFFKFIADLTNNIG